MTPDQRDRYSRQILFSPVGEAGQQRLLASRVAIVGCGALGSFHAAALARAGVGTLRLIDRDYVEPSNLQRQWLYDEADAAEALPKAAAAARAIARFNSSITVEPLIADLTPATADDLLADVDLILDGTDNFETRYLINDFALRFFLSPYELTIFADGRAIIKGTQDIGVARSLYARYIGT